MRLDVVIPAHNEARRIDRTLRAYRSTVNDPMARFVVALDQCTDDTATVVQNHSRLDGRVEVLEYPKLGKGGVLMESFRQCDADVVGFVDADCATPPAEFLRLVETVTGRDEETPTADVAIASRFHPSSVLPVRRSVARRITSRSFSMLVHLMFGLPCADTQCGAKVMCRQVVAAALPLLSSRDFLFDVDLLLTADRLGFRIVEVPTVWLDREGSHVHPAADARRMAASSLRLWLHHRVLPVPSPIVADAPSTGQTAPSAANGHRSGVPQAATGANGARPTPARRARRREVAARWRADSPVDVAMVSPFPTSGDDRLPSGVAAYTSNLVRALADAGATVHVVAPAADGSAKATRALEPAAVRVSREYRRGVWALPTALAAARRTGAPLVHLQHEFFLYGGPSSVPGLVPGLVGLRHHDVRSVVTMHQVVDPAVVDADFTRLHRVQAPAPLARVGLTAAQRSVLGLSDKTVVHEQSFADVLPPAVVVPLGIHRSTPLPRDECRRRLSLRPAGLVVLCFGFLSPYKGLEAALEAAAIAGPSVELVVAGGEHPRLAGRDPYAATLQQRYGYVARFPGYVPEDDVALWFSAADVVLVPYPKPFASSGPFAQALGYGRAVLCSEPFARCVGAPAEMVTATDPRELSRRLVALAERPAELAHLTDLSERMARKRTWTRIAEAHLELYEEVIDAHRVAGRRLRTRQPR